MNATFQPPASHQNRMPLLQLTTVRDLTGLRRDEIIDRVDGASLLHRGFAWVWDFAPRQIRNQKSEIRNQKCPTVRNLRFWRAEVLAYGRPDGRKYGDYELAWVINQILPPGRRHFHSGEVLRLFGLSRNALLRLRAELDGKLAGARNVMFTRENLAAFLQRRWLGAAGVRGSVGMGSRVLGLASGETPEPRRQTPNPSRDARRQTQDPILSGADDTVTNILIPDASSPSPALSTTNGREEEKPKSEIRNRKLLPRMDTSGKSETRNQKSEILNRSIRRERS